MSYLWDTFIYHVHFEMVRNIEEESAVAACSYILQICLLLELILSNKNP